MRRYFAARRVGPPILVLSIVAMTFLIARREQRLSGERQTRATLHKMRQGVSAYLAQSAGKCPEQLEEILPQLGISRLPLDAWGRHFRLLCPAGTEDREFIIISDGVDGLPGGRDRIEF